MLFSLTLFAEEGMEELQQSVETTQEIVDIEQETTAPTEPIVEEISETVQESETLEEDKPEESSLSSLIEKIKTTKAKDRRELMNQLKVELRAMNKEKRQETMRELKKTFAQNGQGQYRHQNLHQNQFRHQPQYRQLRGGQGHRGGRK